MTLFEFGNVVLVPFPFTDQSGTKLRPAAVVSSEVYHHHRPDLLLMPITSQMSAVIRFGDVPLKDWRSAGLLMPGLVKPLIFTLEASLVRKRLGVMVEDDARLLRHGIAQLLG
jgi:mRNA interferase MazF